MKICGIDEAGRGPVIGPMVLAGATYDENTITELETTQITDSKKLSPKKRESLIEYIKNTSTNYDINIVEPFEIDNALNNPDCNLNKLEAIKTQEIISKLTPDIVIIDCPSANPQTYLEYLSSLFKETHTTQIMNHIEYYEMILIFSNNSKFNQIIIKSLYKADEKYKVVGAASILAKVTRDQKVKEIREKIGIDFGSGYPSDPKTIAFLKENHNSFNEIFRKTWSSYKKYKIKENTLKSFLK
jgi:ribonuclease HII